MFDFLKKKLNKTIKDASETTEEEMTQHDKEFAKDLDSLEEAFSSIEDKYSKDSSDEEKVEESPDEVEKTVVEESDETDDGITEESTEKEEDTSEVEEDSSADEDIDEESEDDVEEESTQADEESTYEEINQEDGDEDTQEEGEEDSDKKDSESTDTVDKQKDEETKKGRFSFFRRNKKEDKTDKDKAEEDKKDKDSEEEPADEDAVQNEEASKDDVSDAETEDVSSSDENAEEEKKGRFSFFRRKKKDDEAEEEGKKASDEKESEDKEEEEEKQEDKKPKEDKEESGGMFAFITKKTIKEDDISEILDELFMSLLEGDVAYEVADRIVESVKEDLIGKKIQRRGDMELFTTNALKNAITEIIDNGSFDLLGEIEKSKQNGEPYKIMFVGINGTGKTTTIAKMATYLEKHGYSSVFGASDTFRAGAIEQLEHHAKNLNLKIIKHERNSDPAAVAYDAVEHARATGKDVVLIDTSGRMQTNANLMDEMKKIKRVSKPDFVMYVGDALMGNDATEQATKFNEVIDIDGIILTKADADAKGGAALSIGHVIHKPILFIGTGQSYDDLMEFKPEWMINLIFEE